MNQYRDVLQLSFTDLIKLFDEMETVETIKKLLKEVAVIEQNLKKEDWEMEQSVAILCSKYSKRYIKKVVQTIHGELKVNEQFDIS
ncbi:hypothetical protein [Paenibacillus sp. FSL H7-0331]|uniref:hypothetical protein n=1 Tax=Paenibacillus sp. FSL H7-0331 TaxID=1920421 RepID=UPI0015C2F90A|nr:hypothetical protein [Paenibacillus sp. FSL H7-0331]